MTDWSLLELECPAPPPLVYDPYRYPEYGLYYQKKEQTMEPHVPPQAHHFLKPAPVLARPPMMLAPPVMPPPQVMPPPRAPYMPPPPPKVDNPREIRNRAEKQRRDKMNQSIAELAAIVPQVVSASRKIDKTSVLRLTAHFIRSEYIFENRHHSGFTSSSIQAMLRLFKGFLLTVTYRGLVVIVSHNVNDYLGYTELELLGHNIFNIVHEDDRQILRDQLMPRTQKWGPHGELLLPDDDNERINLAKALAGEQRSFFIRFKKLGQRSAPSKYVTCHIQGSFKMSDRAFREKRRGCQIIRRARARGDNPCSSGNDVVFISMVRPTTECFINETALEAYKMEYKTRHSIDGEIIECEQRISLVTGYMRSEVSGVNAMNFIHREEVRWVVIALKEMYSKRNLYGESCYRLMMRNGQFIYMRTRGHLDVDPDSRAVTSFVCTNTVVDEHEGKQLIKMMKQRYSVEVNNFDQALNEDVDNTNQSSSVAVEDPRLLEKVILNLVTDLPSPETSLDTPNQSPSDQNSPSQRLAIIAPKRERIVSAIEKIYTVIKKIPKQPNSNESLTSSIQYSSNADCNQEDSSDVEFVPNSVYETPFKMVQGPQTHFDVTAIPGIETPPQEYFENFDFPGSSTTGMKRPMNEEDDITAKKKITDANEELVATDRESPSLETFFDDKDLNAEIESAMTLMDNIDPNFFDMLISNEVQSLGQAGSESDASQAYK